LRANCERFFCMKIYYLYNIYEEQVVAQPQLTDFMYLNLY